MFISLKYISASLTFLLLVSPAFADQTPLKSKAGISLLTEPQARMIKDLSGNIPFSNIEKNRKYAAEMWEKNFPVLARGDTNARIKAARKLISIGIALDDLQTVWYGLDALKKFYISIDDSSRLYEILQIKYAVEKAIGADPAIMASTEINLSEVHGDISQKTLWLGKAAGHLKNSNDNSLKLRLNLRLHQIFQDQHMAGVARIAAIRGYNAIDPEPTGDTEAKVSAIVIYAQLLLQEGKYDELISIFQHHKKLINFAEEAQPTAFPVELYRLLAAAYKAKGSLKEADVAYTKGHQFYDRVRQKISKERGLNFITNYVTDNYVRDFIDDYIAFRALNGSEGMAFMMAEKEKAYNLPSEKSLPEFQNYFKKLVGTIQSSSEELLTLSGKISGEQDPTERDRLISDMKRAGLNMRMKFEEAIGRSEMPVDPRVPSITIDKSKVREVAKVGEKSKTAYISYFITKDEVIGFINIDKKVYAKKLAVSPHAVKNYAAQFGAALLLSGEEFYKNSGLWFYANLLYPLFEDVNQPIDTIIYSPDGPLRGIPISAWMSSKGFLAEQLNVIHASNLDIRQIRGLRTETPVPSAGLVCVNPDIPDGKLPFQEEAGKFIAQSPNSSLLNGKECARDRIEAAIQKFNTPIFMHIGAHGTFSQPSPLNSYIALSPTAEDVARFNKGRGLSSADTPLIDSWSGLEIAGTDFSKVDLLTLSSCETGRIQEGKLRGTYGLPQALTLSGVKRVVAPIWSVQDESSAMLMKDFHTEVKKGQAASTALTVAQRKMIQSKLYSHPFYWSAYTYTELNR